MTCEHRRALERAILDVGIQETCRERPWSDHCREWVYFDGFIETAPVRGPLPLESCVRKHAHRGAHDGSELGFICERCKDGVMGLFEMTPVTPVFRG